MGNLAKESPDLVWPGIWYQSRSKAPCRIRVTNVAAAPGDEGGIVTPIREAQSLHVLLYDDPDKGHLSLVESELTRMQSHQLTTALVVIEQMQHLDFSQSLCFMTHVFLMYWARKRWEAGEGSLLDQPLRFLECLPDVEGPLVTYEDVGPVDIPLFGIKALLDFWTTAGARWSAGFTYGGRHDPNIDYTSIPPGNVGSPQSWEGFVRPSENWALDLENLGLPDENAVLKSCGKLWIAKFDGKQVLLDDSKGLTYISYLLARRDVSTVYDVLRAAGDLQDDPTSLHAADQVEAGIEEFGQITSGAPDGYVNSGPDKAAREQIRNEMARLEQQQRGAGTTDLDACARLAEEIRALRQYLATEGYSPARSKADKNAADRVRNAINRSLKVIKEHHPSLYNHLKSRIKTTSTTCYYDAGNEPISWYL